MENITHRAAPLAAVCEYAVASRALAGEQRCGDAALVCATATGTLIAVVDGLGHGDEAARAADVAIRTLRRQVDLPLATLFQRCHEALLPTRGAAIAMATLETSSQSLRWSGIGNIEGLLLSAKEKHYLTNRGGVVGYRLPAVRASELPISPGDWLIFATDGIDEAFTLDDIPSGSADSVARAILDRHEKTTDDALVLVLRWRGPVAGTASESAR